MNYLSNRAFGILAIACLALSAWALGRERYIAGLIFFLGMVGACLVVLWTPEDE